ncbi:MAG: hypothetical protein EXQ74_07265 [Thermoleophilia bacterium]|nr:hypothetical protein [Thermoleophilia bacterium]
MPRSYGSQFRRMGIAQVRNGRRVVDVAASVKVPEATVSRWVRQDKIDRGEIPGTSSQKSTDLRATTRRITELAAEIATVTRASELFAQGRVVRPKGLCPIVETLASEGHGTKRVCRILGVPFTTFYYWRKPPVSARAIRRAWTADVILSIHAQSRQTYRMRRSKAEVADAYGQVVNTKLIRLIMREQGLAGLPVRRRRKPNLAHTLSVEDLVNRDFRRDGPNQLWMTDITEHPTRDGKLSCCVVVDAWSRREVD